MKNKTYDFKELTREYSKKTDMVFFEEQEAVSGQRSIFLANENGHVVCMLRYYDGIGIELRKTKPLSWHPHVSTTPEEAAKLALILREITKQFIVGDAFYYDELAEDVYYGEQAEEAYYLEYKDVIKEAIK